MPLFLYVARDSQGRVIRGNQEAATEAMAASILQGKGLYITQLVNSLAATSSAKKAVKRRHRRVSPEDLHFFILQTANLLMVGIPFVRSLEVIAELTESAPLYQVIHELMNNIKAGSTFKDAISRHPKIFPAYFTYLIEAGELSGTLPQVLTQVAKNLEAQQNLKKKIVSALVYPSVLISASIAAVIFFMIWVVPIFARLFQSFNTPLPGITLAIIGFSQFLQRYFVFLAGGAGLTVYILRRYFRTPNGRRLLHLASLKAPLAGGAVSEIIHARLCIVLAMLIRSGLSFLKSLEVTSNVTGNYYFETALSNIRLDVQQGKSFSASLSENSLFSPMFVNLVKIGEESGRLPEMVDKAGEFFAQRVDIFATRVGILIEPLVMLLVGGTIGVIAVSIFIPIIKLSTIVK